MKASRLNLICLSLLALSSCGKKYDDTRTLPADPYLGASLRKELDMIQKSEWAEDCDSTWGSIKLELINALVEKEVELSTLSETNKPSKATIKFAGSYLENPPFEAPASTQWQYDVISWKSTYEMYQRYRKDPYPSFWQNLNSKVRSLMLEDKRRIVWGVNVGMSNLSAPHIEAFYAAVGKCVQTDSCVAIDFPNEKLKIMRAVPYYNRYLRKLDQEILTSEKREAITNLQNRIKRDLDRVVETINPKLEIKADSTGKHLSLPLDAVGFSPEDQKLIKDTVDSIWKTTGINFDLIFGSADTDPSLYQVLFHLDEPGRRFNVRDDNKTLNLYPGGSVRPIAHEFGHVLGFLDKYYIVWSWRKCEYTQESNPSDLMSDSYSGSVTPEEWKKLLDQIARPTS